MPLLDHLHLQSDITRAEIDDAFLKMVDAENAYKAARQTWAGFNPLCIQALRDLSAAKHEYIRLTTAWFRQTAVLS